MKHAPEKMLIRDKATITAVLVRTYVVRVFRYSYFLCFIECVCSACRIQYDDVIHGLALSILLTRTAYRAI